MRPLRPLCALCVPSQEKTRSTSTIATTFKRQLSALEQTLLATTPHYVRCVKPNKLKQPNFFDAPMILDQLLYSGVLETVRIRRQGFPFRETYPDYWTYCTKHRYVETLVPDSARLIVREGGANRCWGGGRRGASGGKPRCVGPDW